MKMNNANIQVRSIVKQAILLRAIHAVIAHDMKQFVVKSMPTKENSNART